MGGDIMKSFELVNKQIKIEANEQGLSVELPSNDFRTWVSWETLEWILHKAIEIIKNRLQSNTK